MSQSYHAIGGSAYGGVNSMYVNPGATVNQPFKWDVTLFSMQSTLANTAFQIKNKSLTTIYSSPFYLAQGLLKRDLNNNIDFNLLSARFRIDKKSAFAVSFRVRTYNHASGMPFFYNDTIKTLNNFLHLNNSLTYYDGYFTHAAWGELNLNYSRIILQNELSYLSAGINLTYMRGLSGAFFDLSRINFQEGQKNGNNYYVLKKGSATMEYSANYQTANNTSNTQFVKNFIKEALPSFGVSLGAEYLVKNEEGESTPISPTNYNWKIGMAIMDIGRNKFNPINGSFFVTNPKQNITDSILNKQLSGVKNILSLRDTLGRFFKVDTALKNRFTVSLPTRLVISVDKNLGSNFFINGELTLSFYSTQPTSEALKTREINLLSVTPRWETRALGFYLPIQYNTEGMLWVGAAVKLGPVLLGVHNLDFFRWFKPGTQNYNGGGYILVSIHPFGHKQKEQDALPCPKP